MCLLHPLILKRFYEGVRSLPLRQAFAQCASDAGGRPEDEAGGPRVAGPGTARPR
jgi:hypothetical protein